MVNKKAIVGAGLSLFIIAGAVMFTSSSAFADGTDNSLFGKFKGIKASFVGKKAPDKTIIQEKVKAELSTLVSAGTLTQAEADKVAEYYGKYCFNPSNTGDKVNPLEQLVKDGVLTQDKADAVAKAIPIKDRGFKVVFPPKFDLSTLVSSGTLTQAEADKVTEYLKNYRPAKDIAQGEKVNPWDKIVTDGILTQEKADAVKKAIIEEKQKVAKDFADFKKPAEAIKAKLSGLVTAGTLTQAEADKVVEYLEKNRPVKGSTEVGKVNPLAKLVEDGVLTQEKADAIAKTLPMRGHGHMIKGLKGNQQTQPTSESKNF